MSLLHYLSFIETPEKAEQLFESVSKALVPIKDYHWNAINALKDKAVTASWRKVSKAQIVLEPLEKVFKVIPKSIIKLNGKEKGWFKIVKDRGENAPLDQDFEPDFSLTAAVGKGKHAIRYNVKEDDYLHDKKQFFIKIPELIENSPQYISWNDCLLDIEPAWTSSIGKVTRNNEELRFVANDLEITIEAVIQAGDELLFNDIKIDFAILETFDEKLLEKQSMRRYYSMRQPEFPLAKPIDITLEELNSVNIDDLRTDMERCGKHEIYQGQHWLFYFL